MKSLPFESSQSQLSNGTKIIKNGSILRKIWRRRTWQSSQLDSSITFLICINFGKIFTVWKLSISAFQRRKNHQKRIYIKKDMDQSSRGLQKYTKMITKKEKSKLVWFLKQNEYIFFRIFVYLKRRSGIFRIFVYLKRGSEPCAPFLFLFLHKIRPETENSHTYDVIANRRFA